MSIYDGGTLWHYVSFGLADLYAKESQDDGSLAFLLIVGVEGSVREHALAVGIENVSSTRPAFDGCCTMG